MSMIIELVKNHIKCHNANNNNNIDNRNIRKNNNSGSIRIIIDNKNYCNNKNNSVNVKQLNFNYSMDCQYTIFKHRVSKMGMQHYYFPIKTNVVLLSVIIQIDEFIISIFTSKMSKVQLNVLLKI